MTMSTRTPWNQKNKRQKLSTLLIALLLIAAVGIVAYAAANYFFHLHYEVDNSRGVKIEGSWTGEVSGKEVVPGSTFSLNQTITNNSTDYIYLFVRVDTEGNVYKISNLDSSWSVVKEADDEVLLAYGAASSMEEIAPDASVGISGTLTLDVTNAEFVDLDDSALDFSVHACAIAKSQCNGHVSATDVYEDYRSNGGE